MELVTGFGADKVMAAVFSGDADIGFMGSEASIYAYQQGANDKVVNFAQLTQRAGEFPGIQGEDAGVLVGGFKKEKKFWGAEKVAYIHQCKFREYCDFV